MFHPNVPVKKSHQIENGQNGNQPQIGLQYQCLLVRARGEDGVELSLRAWRRAFGAIHLFYAPSERRHAEDSDVCYSLATAIFFTLKGWA